MKKLLSFVIALALFAVVSCGNKTATTTTAAAEMTTTTVEVMAETNMVEEVPANSAQSVESSAGQSVGLE